MKTNGIYKKNKSNLLASVYNNKRNKIKLLYLPLIIFQLISPLSSNDVQPISTIKVDDGKKFTQNEKIIGDGIFKKEGLGTLIINGPTDEFIGDVLVSEGVLDIKTAIGTEGSTLYVLEGAALTGAGTVISSVENDGTIIVGYSDNLDVQNCLKINKDLTQSETGKLQFRIDGNNNYADLLRISGNANLDGKITFDLIEGDYSQEKKFKILEAGSIDQNIDKEINPENQSVSITLKWSEKDLYCSIINKSNPSDPSQINELDGITNDYSNEAQKIKKIELPTIVRLDSNEIMNENQTLEIIDNVTINQNIQYTVDNGTVNVNKPVEVLKNGKFTINNAQINVGSQDLDKNTILLSGEGTLQVQNGSTLINNAQIDAKVYVDQQSTLKGNGTFNKPVTSDGTLWPEKSGGSMNFNNSITMGSNHKYVVEVADSPVSDAQTKAPNVNIGGVAELNGDVIVLLNKGTYTQGEEEYIISQADQLTGSFNNLKWVPLEGMSFSLDYSQDGKVAKIKRTTVGNITLDADQTSGQASKIFYLLSDNSHSTPELDAVADVTNILSAVSSITANATHSTPQGNYFSSRYSLIKKSQKSSQDRLESFLNAVSENGPIVLENKGYCVWISPFASKNKVNTVGNKIGNQGWNLGTLFGFEYNSKKRDYNFGVFGGGTLSRTHLNGIKDTFTKSKGITLGAYHSMQFANGTKYDITIGHLKSYLKNQRYIVINPIKKHKAQSKQDQTSNYVDVLGSHKIYLKDQLSIKFTLGNTFIHTKTGSYTETGASNYNRSQAASTSKSSELYGGIGLENVWLIGENIRFKILGSYEYGYEYYKKGKPGNITVGNIVNVSANPEKAKTHYLTLNTSLGDKNNKVQVLATYNGSFTKNSQGHMFTIKGQYSF